MFWYRIYVIRRCLYLTLNIQCNIIILVPIQLPIFTFTRTSTNTLHIYYTSFHSFSIRHSHSHHTKKTSIFTYLLLLYFRFISVSWIYAKALSYDALLYISSTSSPSSYMRKVHNCHLVRCSIQLCIKCGLSSNLNSYYSYVLHCMIVGVSNYQ